MHFMKGLPLINDKASHAHMYSDQRESCVFVNKTKQECHQAKFQ